MKKLGLSIFILALVCVFSFKSYAKENITVVGGIYFHSELSSYGNWYKLKGGINVWRPSNVSYDWGPYRNGRWFSTDDGWYWDSDEDYGYIAYHYGRWLYDDYYGWVWVPGSVWAPAWVDWRYDDDYIGWAPLPPYAEFSIGIGISFTNNFHYGYNYWNFVSYTNFCSPNVYNYFASNKFKYRIYSKTKYRNNYSYNRGRVINRGVDLKYVRERSRGNIVTRDIKRVDNIRDLNKRDKNYVRAYDPSKKRSIVDRNTRSNKSTDITKNRNNVYRNKINRDIKPRNNTRNKTDRNYRPKTENRPKIYRDNRTKINNKPKIEKRNTERPTRETILKPRRNNQSQKTNIKRSSPSKSRVNKNRKR